MSEKDKKKFDSSAVPFFARYLEGQYCEDLSEEEMDEVYGGLSKRQKIKIAPPHPKDIAVTMKYPSDNEDSSPKHPPVAVSRKYPSDADEAMTHKFPSDGDDELPQHLDRW
jgi:hypothetical protein